MKTKGFELEFNTNALDEDDGVRIIDTKYTHTFDINSQEFLEIVANMRCW